MTHHSDSNPKKGTRTGSPTERALEWVTDMVIRHRVWCIRIQLVLFALSVWFTVAKLGFQTSRDDLVGADKRYHQIYLNFKKEFPAQEDMVVVVESESISRNRQFVERLGVRLESETNLFADVFYKGDLRMMGSKALLFAPEEDLTVLRDKLQAFRPFIGKFLQTSNLVSLFEMVNRQFRTATRETNAQNDALIGALPALERILVGATEAVERHGTPPSPGVDALFGAGPEAENASYVTFARGRLYLVTARASSKENVIPAVERMRQLVAETQAEVTGVNVGLTGESVLEVDEMAQSQTDSIKASILSFIGCGLIFIIGYRETGRPLKAAACLLVGLGYTMGFTTLVVGHLNILTIVFVPILIGLAIDFGVHLVTRYEEELRAGRTEEEAIRLAVVNTGMGVFTGALTTATAFLAMGFTDFKGVREMGIICGAGMLLSLVPMMTMLPALLLRGRQNTIDHGRPPMDRRARLERLWLDRPWITTGITLALTGLAVIGARRVTFDYNLLNMQSDGLPAVVYQKKLIHSADKSVIFGVVAVDSVEEARKLEARFKQLPTVRDVESMSAFLGGNQETKLARVREIKTLVEDLRFAAPDPEPVNTQDLSRTLWSFKGYLGLVAQEVGDQKPELLAEVQSLIRAVEDLRVKLNDSRTADVALKVTELQTALFTDLRDTFAALRDQNADAPLTAADLPPSLRSRFIGVTGKHLLMIYPKKDVWEREPQEEFVDELRTVYPEVTGTPVQLLEYTSLLRRSYEDAAWYALAAIAVMVLVHFRSIPCLVLALIPVGVGFLWMVGLMGWRGLHFNPANIMTLPLVVGIGVTNGIHILNRYAEERSPALLAKSTGKAVLISGLTTIVGFGSLLTAEHRGIESLGFVMSVGVATCLFVSLTFLPALLQMFPWSGPKKTDAKP
jgi:hopanoid biosynthesis associated RND transporter like protein HpnN